MADGPVFLRRAPVALQSYFTNFPNTEDPLSEGNRWIGGFTVGGSWNDVRSLGGLATLSAVDHQTGDFNDQTALLLPNPGFASWRPNIRITGIAKHNPPATTNFRELEFRFRSALSAGVNSGYELNFGVGALSPYSQLMRWNGPHGSFDPINADIAGIPLIVEDDEVVADLIDHAIRIFVNGDQKGAANIAAIAGTVFDTGLPGVGFYNNISTNYGWKSIRVEELP